jgi:hypothetical protein
MSIRTTRLLLALPVLIALAACQTAPENTVLVTSEEVTSVNDLRAAYQADRASILAMAGDYKVTFDFTETVPFLTGYELKEPKLSGGYEVVRVIEDTGEFISLQHILVVGPEDGLFPIKHWRQDWQYQPDNVMVFIGGNAWKMQSVSPDEARGSWSQTVYQVDDAPRYGAVGTWTHTDGISEWTPPAEWRPLPRRDMTTRSDYHAVDAVNRHTITSWGWVHEQDNTKLILSDGKSTALVRETGVNTYKKSDAFDPQIALEYWDATADYWSFIRSEWTQIAKNSPQFAISIKGETEGLYMPLLEIADGIKNGDISLEAARADARDVLDVYVTENIGTLESRLRPTETLPETAE